MSVSCPIVSLCFCSQRFVRSVNNERFEHGGMNVYVLKKLLPLGIRLFYLRNQSEWFTVLRLARLQIDYQVHNTSAELEEDYFRPTSRGETHWCFEPQCWPPIAPSQADRAKLIAYYSHAPNGRQYESPQECFLDMAISKTVLPMQLGQCTWE